MGGGDLNLKKSWHPHTLKNQERVWKAEQQKAEEDRKVAELQRELKEEREREMLRKTAEDSGAVEKKGDAKLDWMYKGPGGHVSREEYLLGRKIDASFEQLEKAEAEEKTEDDSSAAAQQNKAVYTIEHEINPESVTRRDAGNMQVDMHRKLMEDPLLLIRQREEETKREITANPVKMKQLQQLISSIKSKKKTKNKKRRKKKKKHSRSTSSSFDSDSEDERSRKKKKKRKSRKKAVSSSSSSSSDSSSSSSSSEEEKKRKKKKKKEKAHKKHKEEKDKIQGKNIPEERHRHTEPQRTIRDFERNRENKSDLNSFRGRDEHRNWGRNRSRERSEERYRDQRRFDRYERPAKHKKYDHRRERSRSRSRSNERRRYGEGSRSSDSQGSKHRLSEREMERKRQEMVDAARKRDEDRKENVQRYTEERKREEEMEKDVGKFSRTHLLSAASRSSIEDRVKSRVSSAQRGSSHMETNFMRK